jgi:hypothetical protein
MGLLAGINYDPATAVEIPAGNTALLAMTAIDTTNLRLTFTAPSNGAVLVRLNFCVSGGTTYSVYLLGVMDGSTVIARQAPMGAILGTNTASTPAPQESLFTITGLTPGQSYTWDMARGVEVLVNNSKIRYGGPDDTTANNAFGGIQFEVWEAPKLIAAALYDPATAVTHATEAASAMTALDTSDLRHVFNAPASGKVLVRLRGVLHGSTTWPQVMLGVLAGSSVVCRDFVLGAIPSTTGPGSSRLAGESLAVVTGLTPGQAYTWDAAMGVETGVAGTGLKYGGPDNATANDAFGGFLYEIWEA